MYLIVIMNSFTLVLFRASRRIRGRIFAATATTLFNTVLFVDVQVATSTVDLGVKIDKFTGADTVILGNAFTGVTTRNYKSIS